MAWSMFYMYQKPNFDDAIRRVEKRTCIPRWTWQNSRLWTQYVLIHTSTWTIIKLQFEVTHLLQYISTKNIQVATLKKWLTTTKHIIDHALTETVYRCDDEFRKRLHGVIKVLNISFFIQLHAFGRMTYGYFSIDIVIFPFLCLCLIVKYSVLVYIFDKKAIIFSNISMRLIVLLIYILELF